ncbi:MoaD/ThiS family protein [Stygiolobus azoricus]|uniref:Thiamine biosynthesis protein ThiS n=1 Tax=Stygiolobus azoricus TaxID=41675 RepID=A0A650CNV3_9CREN|nr:MoaD/ThiS family protein [Stygiolobus azoricus]QGR19521.1 thiamine biosynthesis protein ThiS [Stygiolobus azoricus]
MKIIVNLIRENKRLEVELPEKATVRDLLKKIGYRVQGSVVVRGDDPLIEDERLNDGDEVKVFLAASGG